MNEKFNKFLIYFKKDIYSYWKLTENNTPDNYKLKRYPISIKQRILEGHYPEPNENGIPLYNDMYHFTTICSFGLGHWELYLDTNKEENLNSVFCVSNYLLDEITENGAFIQCAYGDHREGVSAMIQGEAISLLSRAWEASGNQKYLDAALKAKEPYTKSIENGGVVGIISQTGMPWYEEFTDSPLFHILNGKIYALWGLYDLWLISKDLEAKKLYDDGIESLIQNLHLFDNGYWSNYWHPENGRNYVSSIMYHNLHICQLNYTASITDRIEIKNQARIFEQYSLSTSNRLRSGFSLFTSKLQKTLN